jgi:phospholipid/cholesterol/gamma-HCH transport system ATP-binding protein
MAEAILRYENVSLSFAGQPALIDISFELFPGQTAIVFGAAGSGKSVLLKLATGLLKPDSGRIFLFGQEITTLEEEELFAVRPERLGCSSRKAACSIRRT